jgi:hypothetical protein
VLWDPWDFTGAYDMQLALKIIYQEGWHVCVLVVAIKHFCIFAVVHLLVQFCVCALLSVVNHYCI